MTQPPYEPNNDQHGTGYPPAQPQYTPPGSAYPPSTPGYASSVPSYGQSTSQYGTNPVGQAPSYPAPPVYAPSEPEKKSPVLGIVGLAIVVVCGIIFFACSYSMYSAVFDILGVDWVNTGVVPDLTGFTEAQAASLSGPLIGMLISSLIGIVGFILSIVATVQSKGRTFGIIGIVVGVLAPLSIFIAAGMAGAAGL